MWLEGVTHLQVAMSGAFCLSAASASMIASNLAALQRTMSILDFPVHLRPLGNMPLYMGLCLLDEGVKGHSCLCTRPCPNWNDICVYILMSLAMLVGGQSTSHLPWHAPKMCTAWSRQPIVCSSRSLRRLPLARWLLPGLTGVPLHAQTGGAWRS